VYACALVLHRGCWPAGHSPEALQLREESSKLLSLLEEFQRQLFAALDASGDMRARLGPAQATASALFDSIGEYAKLVWLDGESLVKAKAVVMEVFDAMENLETAHPFSTR